MSQLPLPQVCFICICLFANAADHGQENLRRNNRRAWQYMLPLLFPLAILLYLWQYVGSDKWTPIPVPSCGEHSTLYVVQPGESCWAIVEERGGTLDDLIKMNPDLDCQLLKAGQRICVPTTNPSQRIGGRIHKVPMLRRPWLALY